MRTFMLTWNPQQYRPEDLAEEVRQIANGEPYQGGWSTGNRKDLPIGSRVFLVRQGKEPRGIVAAGYSLTDPEPGERDDDHSVYCDLVWTMVLDDSKGHLLCLDELLNTPLLVNVPWGIRGGGREFSNNEAVQLEMIWSAMLRRLGKSELSWP
jgi:hypothetical protein